jgi:hypothetical protein
MSNTDRTLVERRKTCSAHVKTESAEHVLERVFFLYSNMFYRVLPYSTHVLSVFCQSMFFHIIPMFCPCFVCPYSSTLYPCSTHVLPVFVLSMFYHVLPMFCPCFFQSMFYRVIPMFYPCSVRVCSVHVLPCSTMFCPCLFYPSTTLYQCSTHVPPVFILSIFYPRSIMFCYVLHMFYVLFFVKYYFQLWVVGGALRDIRPHLPMILNRLIGLDR